MKLKVIMLLVTIACIGTLNAQSKSKYDTIRLNDNGSYAAVNVYRIGDMDGTTPRFKLRANISCYVTAHNVGDSIVLVREITAGERIMFVWSNTNKTVYLKSYEPITFSIKEKEATASKTINPVAGATYYLKCSAARGFFEGSPIMNIVNSEIGTKEFKVKKANNYDEYQ